MACFQLAWQHRYRWGSLVGVVSAIGIGSFALTRGLESLELRAQDLRYRIRGPRATHSRIVIASIQDSTFDKWNEPKVAWGTHYARLLRQSLKRGALVVGFDVIPAFDIDTYLADIDAHATRSEALHPNQDFAQAIEAAHGKVALSDIASDVSGLTLLPMFRTISENEDHIGVINFLPKQDQTVRTSLRYDEAHQQPAFSDLLAKLIDKNSLQTRGPQPVRSLLIPPYLTDVGSNAFWINYCGTVFPKIPAEKLENGDLSPSQQALLKNSIVIIGVTYTGTTDLYIDPEGRNCFGVEVHANALATLSDHRPLLRVTSGLECLISIFAAVMMVCCTAWFSFWRGLLILLFGICGWSGISQWLFTVHDFLLPTATPLLAFILPFFGMHAVRSLEEQRHRFQITQIFGNYVGPTVRDYVLSSHERSQLGGKQSDVTILFFDIRGFTSFSQSRPPMEVLTELNELFRHIAPVIDSKQGLLSKFTGDGLLAVFGAPVPLTTHPQAGYEAAKGIINSITALNKQRQAEQKPIWTVGCSLHSGVCVCGNLGGDVRQEYTVIGDTVNLTARVEELNKKYGSSIIMTQATFVRLQSSDALIGPFHETIRGRSGEITIYVDRDYIKEGRAETSPPMEDRVDL